MRILGIDPGTATTGFGIIDRDRQVLTSVEAGVIVTEKHKPAEVRLDELFCALEALIKQYNPSVAAVEQLFFANNQKTALKVGEARGVALLAAAQAGLPVFEYTPLQVKQAVCGYGQADKRQVGTMVTKLLNLKVPPKPDDAADALAVAITHAHTHRNLKSAV